MAEQIIELNTQFVASWLWPFQHSRNIWAPWGGIVSWATGCESSAALQNQLWRCHKQLSGLGTCSVSARSRSWPSWWTTNLKRKGEKEIIFLPFYQLKKKKSENAYPNYPHRRGWREVFLFSLLSYTSLRMWTLLRLLFKYATSTTLAFRAISCPAFPEDSLLHQLELGRHGCRALRLKSAAAGSPSSAWLQLRVQLLHLLGQDLVFPPSVGEDHLHLISGPNLCLGLSPGQGKL